MAKTFFDFYQKTSIECLFDKLAHSKANIRPFSMLFNVFLVLSQSINVSDGNRKTANSISSKMKWMFEQFEYWQNGHLIFILFAYWIVRCACVCGQKTSPTICWSLKANFVVKEDATHFSDKFTSIFSMRLFSPWHFDLLLHLCAWNGVWLQPSH